MDTNKFNKALKAYRNKEYYLANKLYKNLLKNAHNNGTVLFNYALSFYQLKDYKRAIKYYKKSYKILKANEILINIGDAYLKLEKYNKAIKYYNLMLNLEPNNLFALINKGFIYKLKGKYNKALTYYNKVLTLDPSNVDAHWNKSHILLLLGNYKEGFIEYEWRHSKEFSNIQIPKNIPLYNQENLNGKKLLLYPEQGFGDNIQMARYIPLLYELNIDLYVLPLKEQIELFSTIKNIKLISNDEIHKIDYYIKSMSLPYLFETTLNNIPNNLPCFFPKKSKEIENLTKSKKFKVAIAWQGEKNHINDKYRSINIKYLKPLFKIDKIDFYSLQIDSAKNDIKKYDNVIDCSKFINNFHDTANIIKNMDLVISIDSSVAHLSGSLNKKTWLLLPNNPDWRWGLKQKTTPWYKTIKIYRNKKLSTSWKEVIKNVKKDLLKLI